MPSPFTARDAKVSGAIDRAFGELFTIEAFAPAADVNARKAPDPSRLAFVATGVWEGASKSATPRARGSTSDDRAHNWTASFPTVSFDDSALAWPLQSGDKVTRQFDGSIYTVADSFPDAMGRVTIQLTSRKR